MDGDLLRQGLELMLVGMGTVFVFLTLLVLSTLAMSRLVMRLQPSGDPVAVPARRAGSAAAESPARIAALTAAVAHHRARHGGIAAPGPEQRGDRP